MDKNKLIELFPEFNESEIDKSLILIDFLCKNPNQFSSRSKKLSLDSDEGRLEIINKFLRARNKEYKLKEPSTVIDPAAEKIMKTTNYSLEELSNSINKGHQHYMLAENMVGDLLEDYLAQKLEPQGWVWCAGEFVRGTDFIKKDGNQYKQLQIKNRNNTENSSSSKIRVGTDINKWWRLNAKTGETNWGNFPEEIDIDSTDEDFLKFVEKKLEE